jgi:O-antigen/teichoic acid export membrane protein
MAFLLPVWPAYGEALARGDHEWVRSTLRSTVRVSLLMSTAASIALLVVGRSLLHRWAPHIAAPSWSLLVGLACWGVVSSVSVALAMYLNGARMIRIQVVVSGLMAAANLWLSIRLSGRWGAAGPVWASVLTQTGIILIPELVLLRSLLWPEAFSRPPVRRR